MTKCYITLTLTLLISSYIIDISCIWWIWKSTCKVINFLLFEESSNVITAIITFILNYSMFIISCTDLSFFLWSISLYFMMIDWLIDRSEVVWMILQTSHSRKHLHRFSLQHSSLYLPSSDLNFSYLLLRCFWIVEL